MDAEWIATLAATGGAALVGAAATDGWIAARTAFGRLFGRGDARRRELAESRLDATAAEIEAAADADREDVRRAAAQAWTVRLSDLLQEGDEDTAAELRRIVAALPDRRPIRAQAVNTGTAFATEGAVANTGVVIGDVTAAGR
ncbi:hypothetical protein Daura_19805 [Dactylosporangium aurantiacum]|uniref:Uncharacterized protein n=1 Tax=Dactylosporangium aurantiacum TaxID=35754 RepID=A0A9Q9IL90_9ACTN|nr:hypothetical protein [Dactylosporangium aurantiacum]MDG6106290.1 hypothetical protein [Dactylosporangium aurantiacum]UWZ58214.1 hypothetical protein Daura_19805 [Dactylosporangium aurantiacum]